MKLNNSVGPQLQQTQKSGHNKVLLAGIFVLFLLLAMVGATEFVAWQFDFAQELGENFAYLYPPWRVFQWALWWGQIYPNIFSGASGVAAITAVVGLIVIAVIKKTAAGRGVANYIHGSAKWATKKDLEETGLLPKKTLFSSKGGGGLYVGGWVDKHGKFHFLRHKGVEHILCYAPTRSGKGVGLVLPTLLSYPESVIITDLKGELWALTSGWRRQYANNRVLRFEPASSAGGAAWNPLEEIRLGTDYEVGDVQNLAMLIVDPSGGGLERLDHWAKTSFALLSGVILHALYKAKNGDGEPATLPLIDKIMSDPTQDITELWIEMATYPHLESGNHPAVGSAAKDMIDRPEEEGGSVLSTAKSFLSLYRDPVVAKNVSRSDFKITDIMNFDAPVSLYIVTQPSDKDRLKPLVRMLLSMALKVLAPKQKYEEGVQVKSYKHKLLMMLDEFPSLGKLEILEESLAFVAGFGIRMYLICQDINQLKSEKTGYGRDEKITSNCHIQSAYPPNRLETAQYLSSLAGETTIIKEQVTISGGGILGNRQRTKQEVRRNLLTPDECLRMPGPKKDSEGRITEAGDMVVYLAGYPAIYGKQPLYFKNQIFSDRAKVNAPEKSDVIHFPPAKRVFAL